MAANFTAQLYRTSPWEMALLSMLRRKCVVCSFFCEAAIIRKVSVTNSCSRISPTTENPIRSLPPSILPSLIPALSPPPPLLPLPRRMKQKNHPSQAHLAIPSYLHARRTNLLQHTLIPHLQ